MTIKTAKKRFKAAFKEAAKQLNVVKQYYEFIWDNKSFGLDEHKWLQYVGAYRNLFPEMKLDQKRKRLGNYKEEPKFKGLKLLMLRAS